MHGPKRLRRRRGRYERLTPKRYRRDVAKTTVIDTYPKSRLLQYPSREQIIELNKQLLEKVRVKKADKHEVLLPSAIEFVIEEVRMSYGDTYDKATILLVGLTQKFHIFGSGNRRTAFEATRVFLVLNGEEFRAEVNPRAMQGIREGFYSKKEIKEWLKGNGIREFNRFAPKEEWKGR